MKVYELGIKKFAVREPENSILCSMNHPQALKLELKYDPKESMARYNFALDFMKKEYGKLSVDKLIEFISTDYIADTNKRILQSIVIMAPKQLDFWVAVQKRDNKQACFNPFLKFNLLEGINK